MAPESTNQGALQSPHGANAEWRQSDEGNLILNSAYKDIHISVAAPTLQTAAFE